LVRARLKSDDPLMKDMTKTMMDKFDKYWSEHSITLLIDMIL